MNPSQVRKFSRTGALVTCLGFFLLFRSPLVLAGTETKVRVGGSGQTEDEAVKDALRVATMKGCKTTVISKDVYENKRVLDQNLTTFSGCIVNEFTFLKSPELRGDLYQVNIEAIVVESRALERLKRYEDKSASDVVFYQNLQGNLYSAKVRLENRPKLIGFALDSYPQGALTLSPSRPTVKWTREKKSGENSWDYTERGTVTISYQIKFDESFLSALDDVLLLARDLPGEKLERAKAKKTASDSSEDISPIGAIVALPFLVGEAALKVSFGLIGCLFGACPDESQSSDSVEPKSSVPQSPEMVPSIIQIQRSHKFRDPGVFFQIRELMIEKKIAINVQIYQGQELVKSTCEAINVRNLFAESEPNLIIGESGSIRQSISTELNDNFGRQPKVQSNIMLQTDCATSITEGSGQRGGGATPHTGPAGPDRRPPGN